MTTLLILTLLMLGADEWATPLSLAQPVQPQAVHVRHWPKAHPPTLADAQTEAAIAQLLKRMTLEQKVGQLIMADINSVTPAEVRDYHLGAILNGGTSAPATRKASDWLALADAYYTASLQPVGDLPRIPVLWGTDAVHGHNNVVGATLFPHNIGLGAARDPELVKRIGAATAVEMQATGLGWTFAPTLAVARDDRWGRTYESYAEDPALVATYARAMIEGLQGVAGEPDWLHHQHVIATAKHFVGDGGTHLGKDQGDCVLPERKLAKVHGRAYAPAITAGVQVVMASYNSWQGVKLHGNAPLLTQVLRQRMQFDGVVVGDWNGHGQVAGCTNTSCPAALMAGVDMLMAPDSWKGLYANTLDQVNSGQIPLARVDEAVSRILRLKYRAKLFDAGLPSSRPTAGQFELLGQPAHRALARQAVQASLVLLKNERQTLPLRRGSHIVVTGDAANDSQQQAGGWSLSWQGADANPADFIGVTTIGQGLQQVAATHGATVELNPQGGLWQQRPDVAVVVFGEPPYAEYKGDRSTVAFEEAGNNLALLQQYQAQGIPTVAVFLSGRPLWVNPYLNAADAFVAAWLPGSEGQGVADVLFGDVDFKGQLSFSWPSSPHQSELNRGDDGYQPLFPYGYGLSYARPGHVGHLSEELPVADKH